MIKRKQTRLLVESILRGNTDRADKLLAKLISEAEGDRQEEAHAEANEELGLDDEEDFDAGGEDLGAGNDDAGSDEGDDGDEFEALDDVPESPADDEFAAQEQMATSDTELNDMVDKQVNFEVQVNNLVLNDLQNQCADLKTALENNTALDKHSREYYEIKVPLQYYGETLTKIQKNITPLVNQDEIKKQLDEISSSLQELSDKIGGNEPEEIATPNQIMEKEAGTEF